MAIHDHDRRTPRDYMHDARSRYSDANTGTKSIGLLIGLALLGFIAYMLLATPSQDPTGGITRSTPTTTAPAPGAPTTAPTTQPK